MKNLKKMAFMPLLFCVLSSGALADFQFTFDGHTYDVITSGLTWADASTAAQNKSINGKPGYLARIDSEHENDEIFSQLLNNIDPSDFANTLAPDGGGASYVWIGANDIQTEGQWVWVDNGAQFWQGDNTGSAVDALYNNWGIEPDDFNGQDAAGIALTDWPFGVAGQWNDVDTDNTLYYIIEYATDVNFGINAAISDAWFFPDTAGQGFFIIVWEDSKLVFLAWFTYDTERPPEDVTALLGEPGHRWLTALGPYEGNTALLDVFLSSGMIFDSAEPPVTTEQYEGAWIEIVWTDCKTGLVKYEIPSLDLIGEIPIERIVDDNVAACESFNAPTPDPEPPGLEGITAAHNVVRDSLGVGMPQLVWDPDLAVIAQAWADGCVDNDAPSGLIDHNPNRGSNYPGTVGENIFGKSGGVPPTPQEAVNAWAGEEADYDYDSNTCSGVCGHYTQIVWATTERLGCGISQCAELQFGGTIVCNYSPAGNIRGVRPY